MSPRRNDTLDAFITAYMTIPTISVDRNGTGIILTEELLAQLQEVHDTALWPVSPEIAHNEPEETIAQHSEELDDFLDKFTIKEVVMNQ